MLERSKNTTIISKGPLVGSCDMLVGFWLQAQKNTRV